MSPGQKIWGTQSVPGGWYRGSETLKSMLVKAGLPAAAPGDDVISGPPTGEPSLSRRCGRRIRRRRAVLLYRRRRSTPR